MRRERVCVMCDIHNIPMCVCMNVMILEYTRLDERRGWI